MATDDKKIIRIINPHGHIEEAPLVAMPSNQMVSVPEICGNQWWGFGHAWAETIARDGCASCGQHAVMAMRGLHAAVNVQLGKPPFAPAELKELAAFTHKMVHQAGLWCDIHQSGENVGRPTPLEVAAEPGVDLGDGWIVEMRQQLEMEFPDDPTQFVNKELQPLLIDTRLVHRFDADGGSLTDRPIIDSPESIAALFRDLQDSDRERLFAAYFTTRNQLIGIHEVNVGRLADSLVSKNAIVRAAVLSDAKGVAIVHNHPSGNLSPSDPDVGISDILARSLFTVEIELIDSLIIGHGGEFRSLRDMGKLVGYHALQTEEATAMKAAIDRPAAVAEKVQQMGLGSHDWPPPPKRGQFYGKDEFAGMALAGPVQPGSIQSIDAGTHRVIVGIPASGGDPIKLQVLHPSTERAELAVDAERVVIPTVGDPSLLDPQTANEVAAILEGLGISKSVRIVT